MLREHGLALTLSGEEDHVFPFGHTVECQDAFDTGAMDLLWPSPLKISHRLEAADPRFFEASFHALAGPRVEFGADQCLEQDDPTPALLRGARDEVIHIRRGLGQPPLP